MSKGSRSCRLCASELSAEAIIELAGMPKAAQFFPREDEFAEDNGIDLNLYQCSACGLVQLSIEPVDYFRDVITAASMSPKARAVRLEQMNKFVERFSLKGKKVLEVGCAKGLMLDVFEEAGMQAYGLEAADDSVAEAQSKGLNVIKGYIGEVDQVEGVPFDAFVCLNYFEHLPDPGAIIQKISSLTSENAVGYVTVPNLEYLLKTRCFYEFVADHLSYFTRETLRFAFESNGYEVLSCETIQHDNDIAVMVRKRPQLNIAHQYTEVQALIDHLKSLMADYVKVGKKVAVWGAGHRTLALLALSDLKQISYVVDSAKFKQGRFTPVNHTPIVAPEHLIENPVDLVIVMVPGIYPDEVIKQISTMNLSCETAKLVDNKIEFIEK